MKITIDTTFKPHRVEIEGDCTIGELIEFLSKYYPDFTWKDVRIGGKINLGGTGYQGYRGGTTSPHIQPFTTQPWPTIGGGTNDIWTIGDFPGPTITYASDSNSFTNSAGETVQVSNLLNVTSG